MKQEPGKLFLHIENTYTGSLRKSGNVFKTTKVKKKGHGIGLKNVQRVVDAYHGEMVIDDKNDVFSVSLLIYFLHQNTSISTSTDSAAKNIV